MSGTSVILVVIIVAVVFLTATANMLIAKANRLNPTKWFIQGLILPFISLVFLYQAIAKKKEEIRRKKLLEKKEQERLEQIRRKKEKAEANNADKKQKLDDIHGFDDEELKARIEQKKQLLDRIREKHEVKIENLTLRTNDDLKAFMQGYWIYENPKNSSIFQVFVFKEGIMRVDASFPRFAVSAKEVSFTTTLMGNYLRLQGKPQKIHVVSKNEIVIGARSLIKLSPLEYKDLSDVLHKIESDLEVLFGSSDDSNAKSPNRVA